VLERIPAQLKVIRHIRPRLSCRSCETIIQAPAPDLPIEKGRPGPALIANVVVGKYIDGLPLYRQAGIIARGGVDIDRSTLCDWVGRAAWWLAPVAEAIGRHVMAAPAIHTDDTPIGLLAPGKGRTKTGGSGPMSSMNDPCLSGCHIDLLNVGCSHPPEYSSA